MSTSREQVIDELLVMDCQAGKNEAFDLLVSRWQKRLWHHAYRLVGSTEAAWDITQQSWIGIIKGLRKLRDPANFRAWAYRITTNKSINWIRKNNAVKNVSIEELQYRRHSEKKDTGVNELLEKLDMEKRTVLSLYYFGQLSISEVSIVLDIPK